MVDIFRILINEHMVVKMTVREYKVHYYQSFYKGLYDWKFIIGIISINQGCFDYIKDCFVYYHRSTDDFGKLIINQRDKVLGTQANCSIIFMDHHIFSNCSLYIRKIIYHSLATSNSCCT